MITGTVLLLAALVQSDSVPPDSAPRSRTTILPVISYSDVTGIQYGAALFRGFRAGNRSDTRPSSVALHAALTARDHAKAYAQVDRWSPGNAGRLRARVEYTSYPLPYFGIGNAAPDSAEEWYSSGVQTYQLFHERELRAPFFLHGGVRIVRSRMRETAAGGALAGGEVPGSSGADTYLYELGVVLDSRDHPGSPRAGMYARIIPALSASSPATAGRVTIDVRRYSALGMAGSLATQFQYDGVGGSATAFDLLPMIGGDTAMRGYPRGRFRDRHALTAQAEWRSAYWRRVGVVTFAGAGTVAHTVSRLASGSWYPTAGTGARYLLSPRDRIVLRADLAIGRGSFGFSVGVGQAF